MGHVTFTQLGEELQESPQFLTGIAVGAGVPVERIGPMYIVKVADVDRIRDIVSNMPIVGGRKGRSKHKRPRRAIPA